MAWELPISNECLRSAAIDCQCHCIDFDIERVQLSATPLPWEVSVRTAYRRWQAAGYEWIRH